MAVTHGSSSWTNGSGSAWQKRPLNLWTPRIRTEEILGFPRPIHLFYDLSRTLVQTDACNYTYSKTENMVDFSEFLDVKCVTLARP
jgi:hypothetical protein